MLIKHVPYPQFLMMATWSRAEMLRTPMKRVTAIPYSCVKRKMRGEGRGPATENRRNSTHITVTAGAVRVRK